MIGFMDRPRVKQRSRPRAALVVPALALIAGLPLVASCAAAEPPAPAPTPTVRTDLDPLKRRFPQLGSLSGATWVSRVLTQNSVDWVPGPTDVSLDGVAQVEPATLAAITSSGTWEEAVIECGVPKEIATEVGGETGWLHSRAFDESITRTQYSGSFYFDKQTGRVYFCTINPKVRTEG
ncbi:hypothetical protein ACFVUY_04120 [Kitasatospora sp. NPDC058063]|uniref:hypothetical protein n=1 Tax=unclassified Kitasatospora TaxID=2633591 RepID=UPI0036DF50CF